MPRNSGNSYALRRFEGGRPLMEQLTADRLNSILDFIQMCWPIFGLNITGKRYPGGTVLNGEKGGGGGGNSTHAYTCFNKSVGSVPKLGVLPGTTSGIVPTIDGSPINVKIGLPLAYPALTLDPADTRAYFQIDYGINNLPFEISIHSCNEASWVSLMSAINIVSGTAGSDYKLLTTLTINTAVDTGNRTVVPNNDAVSGPQIYRQCGHGSDVWLG